MPLTVSRPPGAARQLPGIRFDTSPPQPPEVLPRMDIAGFVGFSASGPINVPVPIEDPARFDEVFGTDAPIAWDPIGSEQAYALLAPAVRAFFRNGGRRCWVVRVAGATAAADTFQIPGVAAVSADGTIGPAIVRACSRGSWADGLEVSAAVESVPVQAAWSPEQPASLVVTSARRDVVNPGDLLRVTFEATTLVLTVGSVTPALTSPPGAAGSVAQDVAAEAQVWVTPAVLAPGSQVELGHLGTDGTAASTVARVAGVSPPDGTARLEFDPPIAQAPGAGGLLSATVDGVQMLLEVTQVEATGAGVTAIVVDVLRADQTPRADPGKPDAFAELLTLRLQVDAPAGAPLALGGIGYAPEHPVYLGRLPSDETLYAVDPSGRADSLPLATQVPDTIAAAVSAPRFPLAGPVSNPWAAGAPVAWCFPLAATILPSPALGATFGTANTRERDGLQSFAADLFLDPALEGVGADQLLETANQVRYGTPVLLGPGAADEPPRSFAGIHALLENDEISLLAVPDAVLPGWSLEAATNPLPSAPPDPAPAPDWSRFLACSTRVPSTPTLAVTSRPGGISHLSWRASDAPGASYEVDQASDPGFATAEQVYSGLGLELDLGRPPDGATVYVRVRAVAGGMSSAWSVAPPIGVPGLERWLIDDPVHYSAGAMMAVQAGALRMCAARGDLLAMLALPEHYRASDAIAHVDGLKREIGAPAGSPPDPIFSFGALYLPWLYVAEPDAPSAFRGSPPDGAATGMAAQRSSQRGPWIAPANQPLLDVIALDEPIPPGSYQALLNAQVNVVRQAPGGFLVLAADTLSDDPDLRPIVVRRLLGLLRRTALRYGDTSTFEANDARTRRTIVRTFEALLGRMFSLGAFAGATAAEGFQVSTPVTADDLDEGRLIVELRVAPSRPLSFLTVRLVRSGTGGLTVESR